METIGLILSIIAGLLILVFLIVIHELGHGIIARRNGVVVEEFGVGFPPRAKGKKIKKSLLGKNVLYSLNWLPIGGFVKLKGEYDAANRKGDYGAASFWQKTKIILAGVVANWLMAVVLFTILAVIGMPKLLANQFTVASDTSETRYPLIVADVIKDSPAEQVGIKAGDEIVSLAGSTELAEISSAVATTRERAGQELELEVRSPDQPTRQVAVKLNTPENARDGYLGVQFSQQSTVLRSTWSAPIVGVGFTSQLSWEILKGIGGLLNNVWQGIVGSLTGNQAEADKLGIAGDSVAGPVGIVGKILPGAVSAGLVPVLMISAILSATLAVMNILPIPALDGGRWYLMALFKLLNKPLTREIEEKVNGYGMIFLLGLIVLITVLDVGKLF